METIGEKQVKRWATKYCSTLILSAFFIVAGVLPEVVSSINGIPDFRSLKLEQGRIIRTQPTEPHLSVELADGSIREMEWPIPISLHGQFRFHKWTDEQQVALKGCDVTFMGHDLRWTIRERYRVWELVCLDKNIAISAEQSAREYESWMRNRYGFALVAPLAGVIFIFLVFLRERRGAL